jgi:hypothetical protein
VLEPAWWPVQRSLHAVGDGGGPAVADGGEDSGEHLRDGSRYSPGRLLFDVDLGTYVNMVGLMSGGLGDEVDGLAEADRPGAGEGVDLAVVAVLDERGGGDLRDVARPSPPGYVSTGACAARK